MNIIEQTFYKIIANEMLKINKERIKEEHKERDREEEEFEGYINKEKKSEEYVYINDKLGREYVKRTTRPDSPRQLMNQFNFTSIAKDGKNAEDIQEKLKKQMTGKPPQELYEEITGQEVYIKKTEKELDKEKRKKMLDEIKYKYTL